MPIYSDLAVYAKWNDFSGQSFDIDLVRDGGGKTPSKIGSGTGSIDAGSKFGAGALKFAGDGISYLHWYESNLISALVNSLTVEFFVKPLYSGTPSAHQVFYCSGMQAGSNVNLIYILHSSSDGSLYVYFYDSSGALIGSCSGAFSPNGSSWYHVSYNGAFAPSSASAAHRLFVHGGQLGSTSYGAGTRNSSSQLIRIGTDVSGSAYVPHFVLDDLRLYDTVKRIANFTPPASELSLDYQPDLIVPAFLGKGLASRNAGLISTGIKYEKIDDYVDGFQEQSYRCISFSR